jgi:hypothetical protein
MSSKDKKVKLIIELAIVEARISELERTKTYLNSLTYYRNRLTTLTDTAEKLRRELDGHDETQSVKLVFELPAGIFGKELKEKRTPVDFLQFMKKEYLIQE